MTNQLTCEVVQKGDPVVIGLDGFLDSHNAHLFKEALAQQVGGGCPRIVVDFSGLDYIGSSGLEAIISQLQPSREKGGDIRCCCMNPKVFKVFDLLGLPQVLNIFPERSEALASF